MATALSNSNTGTVQGALITNKMDDIDGFNQGPVASPIKPFANMQNNQLGLFYEGHFDAEYVTA